MINNEVYKLLNDQFNMEMQAHYKYLAISSYCQLLSLDGFGKWFAMQSEEEKEHAMKIHDYLMDLDKSVTFQSIDAVKYDFKSIIEAFEAALKSEQAVSKSINKIYAEAQKADDFASSIFLEWFITEQIEEEKSIRDIIDKLNIIEGSGEGLLMLDKELGSRGAGH